MNVQLETSKLNEATNFQMIEALQQPFSSLYDNLWVWKFEKKLQSILEKSNLFNTQILTVQKNNVTNDFEMMKMFC